MITPGGSKAQTAPEVTKHNQVSGPESGQYKGRSVKLSSDVKQIPPAAADSIPAAKKLASRIVTPKTSSSITEGTPLTHDRSPVISLFGIKLNSQMDQTTADNILDNFGKNTVCDLDLDSEDTHQLLSALNKTGKRLVLTASEYQTVMKKCPELIWSRFVISEENVLTDNSVTPPVTLFVEHGTDPNTIKACLLDTFLNPDGLTRQHIQDRKDHVEALALFSILTSLTIEEQKLLIPNLTKDEIGAIGAINSHYINSKNELESPTYNADLRANCRSILKHILSKVRPVFIEQCLKSNEYLSDPLRFAPGLSVLGEKAEEIYQQQASNADNSKPEFPHYNFEKEFEHKALNNRSTEEFFQTNPAASTAYPRQTLLAKNNKGLLYPFPVKGENGQLEMDNWVKQHKLHQSLARASSKDGKPTPLFLGFVPPETANKVVLKHGSFRDHGLSDNILHTKNVHDLQMALLRDAGLVNDSFYEELFKKPPVQSGNVSPWGAMYDRTCISPIEDSIIGDRAIRHPALNLTAPSFIYPLMSSQELSKSIALCADKAEPAQLTQLYQRFYPDAPSMTEEGMRSELKAMSRHINAVEVSMIASNYKDLRKAGEVTAPLFEQKFADSGKPYKESHPVLKALEMYDKVDTVGYCDFITDAEMNDLGKKAYESKVLRDKEGKMLETEDGDCYLLPGGHFISKDFAILYKNRPLPT